MATILDYYEYAKLASAAYVNMDSAPNLNGATFATAADGQRRLPRALANQMFDPGSDEAEGLEVWTIPPGGYYGNDASGFAATLFQRGSEKVLAIRGTEPTANSGLDLQVDLAEIGLLGTALTQEVAMINYIERLRMPVNSNAVQIQVHTSLTPPPEGTPYATAAGTLPNTSVYIYFTSSVVTNAGLGLLGSGEKITVTGHSLGGHLAAMAARLYPDLIEEAYLYNAPGFDPLSTLANPFVSAGLTTHLANQMGPAALNIAAAQRLTDELVTLLDRYTGGNAAASFAGLTIHSLESEDLAPGDDTDLVSGVLTGASAAAQKISTTTEANSHLIEPFMDSLALHAMLYTLDDSLTLPQITSLYEAASTKTRDSQEKLVEALDRLFATNADELSKAEKPLRVVDAGSDDGALSLAGIGAGNVAGRREYYERMVALEKKVKDLTDGGATFNLVSLTAKSQLNLQALALIPSATGLAYRYALSALNPFALLGADYSFHNTDAQLELYNPTERTGTLTDEWLKDRSAFLVNKMLAGVSDSEASGRPWVQSSQVVGAPQYFEDRGAETPYRLWVGTNSTVVNQAVPFMSQIRFGSDAPDNLTGSDKWDKLYGGPGNDFLKGAQGDDYLEGGQGEDIYYYSAGDGHDTLMRNRSSGEYTLSFRSLEYADKKEGGDWERDGVSGTAGEIKSHGFALAQIAAMEA